uniref:Reverse transcriptase domain-containing protein n=1 Tax=Tanacetum cinerariifolium TaxID=118510 RepID=A0A6L2KKT6_TANCI|nr:reverse transcriptase domain-containing protein [Tanacetum cinerariifolium]
MPNGCVDNWTDLREAFVERFALRRKCCRGPAEVSKIVRKANKTLPNFKERWTEEMSYIPDVPIVMQISSFMSNSKCPELARRFSDHVPRTLTEMMKRVDNFVKSKEAFKNTELPKGEHPKKGTTTQFRGSRAPRHPYGNGSQRPDAYNRRDHYQSYVPSRAPDRRCDNRRHDHQRQEVNHLRAQHKRLFSLKKQLEVALESRKLNHLIKDVRQKGNNRGRQTGNNNGRGKVINMVRESGKELKPGSESRPPMLNKENYVPWSSRLRLLRYAKSRPNGKLIHNSIINGPYVRRIIPEPSDTNREVPMNETFHVQTDDELTEKELKQIKADDQAIQTILLDLPEDIYAAVDSCETAQEIWLRVQQMMKGFDIGIHEKKAKISSNPHNRQIAQPGKNMGQDRQMQMVGGNGKNQFRQYAGQNAGNLNGQNGLIGVLENANQNGNGNLVAARAEGNAAGHNGNQIRDAAYLQTQLLIAQKEEAGIQLQAKEFDLMAAAADLDEIEEFNANCILMANLQQASTSGTQTDKAPIYDSDGSTEVHDDENCDDNEIFNMFTQEEHDNLIISITNRS